MSVLGTALKEQFQAGTILSSQRAESMNEYLRETYGIETTGPVQLVLYKNENASGNDNAIMLNAVEYTPSIGMTKSSKQIKTLSYAEACLAIQDFDRNMGQHSVYKTPVLSK